MTEHINWADRQFQFTFPVGTYPELIERLRGTPARLAERLTAVPASHLVQRHGSSWSMQEHAGHLADLDETLFLRRLDDYENGVPILRAADMTNPGTEAAQHNRRPLADVLGECRTIRHRLVARLEGLEADAFARVARHPRLRCPMRLVDMLFFHAEHDDYHLARITALRRSAGAT
jgi:uncharacterized damage-inducible protein DinB